MLEKPSYEFEPFALDQTTGVIYKKIPVNRPELGKAHKRQWVAFLSFPADQKPAEREAMAKRLDEMLAQATVGLRAQLDAEGETTPLPQPEPPAAECLDAVCSHCGWRGLWSEGREFAREQGGPRKARCP